jgi:PAS domain S-box-containing protein
MTNQAFKDQKQRIAEAEVNDLRKMLGPFVVAAEETRMPMVFTDAAKSDNPIIFANDSFLKLIGYPRDEVLAQSFNFILAQGADDEEMRKVAAAFTDRSYQDVEVRYRRKDGSQFWANMHVAPVRDDHGKIVQHFLSLADITRFKTAEHNAAQLIDELNHRVKNTLSTVQFIVSQAVGSSQDPQVVGLAIEERIGALSRSHDLLHREQWRGVGLHDLVSEALAPFRGDSSRAHRLTIEGENVRLTPQATLALGIAFNELATNAAKYGAFVNDEGTISIKWTVEDEQDGKWLSLQWRETGGPRVTAPVRRGFGTRVIERGLAHELSGKIDLEFLPTGVVCTIFVPAPMAILDE